VVPEKPQDNPLDLSHPKRHNVEQLKKPYLASRNFKPVSNPKNTFILIIHQLFSLSAGPAAWASSIFYVHLKTGAYKFVEGIYWGETYSPGEFS